MQVLAVALLERSPLCKPPAAECSLVLAIVSDEAHRAARLKLIPQFAKKCRKYGLSLILASQEAKDLNVSLYSAIGSHLVILLSGAIWSSE